MKALGVQILDMVVCRTTTSSLCNLDINSHQFTKHQYSNDRLSKKISVLIIN